jgi:LacI family transcriptional regulator
MGRKAGPAGALPQRRPTMNDVAARAGVGLKTVSRVVNGESVRPATAELVHAAIAELGYRRNDSARLLRQGTTATIGLLQDDVADPFYSVLARAVEEVVIGRDHLLLTASTGGDARRARDLVTVFCARRVDGLIIVPPAGADLSYLQVEIDAGIRAVFVDRPPQGVTADAVLADNVGGTREGIAHLIAHGHRRIAFLGDRGDLFTAQERLRGYREALAAEGIPYDAALVRLGEPDGEALEAALRSMRSQASPPTAVFTGNGPLSVALIRVLSRWPARPAHVGFDDFELADCLSPGVSVVAQSPAAMGRTAAQMLFQRLTGDEGPAQRVLIETTLIPRGSGEVPPG